MARKIKDQRLGSREGRSKLEARNAPYWTHITGDLFVGYRKGLRVGSWLVRWFDKADGRVQEKLGTADDIADADGKSILTFDQAQETARQWLQNRNAPKPMAPLTVRQAVDDYLEDYKAGQTKGRGKGLTAANATINAHILPALGDKLVGDLTAADIKGWHRKLATTAARLRSAKDAETANTRKLEGDEAKRSRKSTANRILTTLKAILNHAWREGRVPSPDAWSRVKPFAEVEAPKVRYLTVEECVRLTNACPADFRQLVRAALHTGARYGEMAALKVTDFSPDGGTVHIRQSKSGKARHIILTDAGIKFFEQVCTGKAGAALMFTTNSHSWGKSHQHRPIKDACTAAKISPAISFHILRHTYASQAVMAGIPLMVVAENLGHTDTRMVERHYGHLAQTYKVKIIRDQMPTLGGQDDTNVVALHHGIG